MLILTINQRRICFALLFCLKNKKVRDRREKLEKMLKKKQKIGKAKKKRRKKIILKEFNEYKHNHWDKKSFL